MKTARKFVSAKITNLEINSRHHCVLLAIIATLALGLRLFKLGEWSFWIDEIYTIGRAQAHVNLETIVAEWWQPSISLVLTGGLIRVLGVSEWSARLGSVIIGIISLPVLYFPIKRQFGLRVALIAVLLLAVSPWHVYWSQNARFYTSLMLLYTLALFSFFVGMERDNPWYIVLFLLLLFLAMGERLIALFAVPVVVLYWTVLKIAPFEKPLGLRTRNLILVLLPGVAVAIFDAYRFLATGSSSLHHLLGTFSGKPIDSPIRILILVAFKTGVLLISVALCSGVGLLLQKSRAGLFLLAGALIPPFLLAGVSPFMFAVDRYVFASLPSWIILAAVGINNALSWPHRQSKLLAVGILLSLLADAAGTHLMYYAINHGDRPDWRTAFAFVEERKAEGDIVVSSVPEIGTYYTQEQVIWLGDIEPDVIEDGNRRYWFVMDSENSWWSGREKEWVEANAALVEAWYLRMREDMHLRVYLYDPAHSQVGRASLFSSRSVPSHNRQTVMSLKPIGFRPREEPAG